jgi:hypothetical protein
VIGHPVAFAPALTTRRRVARQEALNCTPTPTPRAAPCNSPSVSGQARAAMPSAPSLSAAPFIASSACLTCGCTPGSREIHVQVWLGQRERCQHLRRVAPATRHAWWAGRDVARRGPRHNDSSESAAARAWPDCQRMFAIDVHGSSTRRCGSGPLLRGPCSGPAEDRRRFRRSQSYPAAGQDSRQCTEPTRSERKQPPSHPPATLNTSKPT